MFILEACRAGIRKDAIRAMLGIDRLRITRISKHVRET